MRAAFFFLILFLVSPDAGARAKLAGVKAGDEAYRKLCQLNYSRFEDSIARRRELEAPSYDKMRRMRERFERFRKVNGAHNREFNDLARRANAGEITAAEAFYFSENAVLKELNDKVIADKDLVTALTNLRKDLEHFHLTLDPEIAPHIVAQSSDFKVFQLALDSAEPKLLAKIQQKVAMMNERYAEFLADAAAERGWVARGNGLAKDPRSWFHAGVGATADEASLAARDSRTVKWGEAGPQVRSFLQARGNLERAGRFADRYQAWAARRFADVDGFLSAAGNGEKVLSAEAIETMKKVSPAAPTAEAYRDAVIAAIDERFHLRVSPKEADALKNYLSLSDRFSPSLLLDERIEIDMGQAAAAVVSADFKGQGARNIEETMKALAQTKGEPLAGRVQEVRRGEELATGKMEALKGKYAEALQDTVPGLRGQFSGDDGMGFLAKSFAEEDKIRFVKNWLNRRGALGDLRLTFENFRYRDTGKLIPKDARSELVVSAEAVEKKLRAKLLKTLGRKELNDTMILVSLEGEEHGPGRVSLILLNKGGERPGVAAAAAALTKELGYGVGRVVMRAP